MRALRAHWIAILLSAGGALLGAYIMDPARWKPEEGGDILWVGLVFAAIFLLAFLGMYIGLQYFGKYRGVMSKDWVRWFAVALVGLFLVGAGGEALYPNDDETIVNKIPRDQQGPKDLVLAMDCSGSMAGDKMAASIEAACQFVDILDDQTNLQVISYANIVIDSTRFLPMDDAGRAEVKAFIQAIDSTGGTDFELPLAEAMETLSNYGRSGCDQAVLMLTDGEATISSSITQQFQTANIKVHAVRILDYGGYSGRKDLINLSKDTGGVDVEVKTDRSGNVDVQQLLDSFTQVVYDTETETIEGSHDTLLTGYMGENVLLRTAVICLCYVLASIGFYGKPNGKSLAIRLLIGAGIGVLAMVTESYWGFMVLYLLTVGFAWVFVRPGPEREIYV